MCLIMLVLPYRLVMNSGIIVLYYASLTQRRRNLGGLGVPEPPKFWPSALFPVAKCRFLPWGHFWKLEFILFPDISWYIRKIFFIFRKKCDMSGKLFWYVRKIFLRWHPPSPPHREHFRGKNFRCPFLLEKCPSKPGPQLLETSYAPGLIPYRLVMTSGI